MSRKTFTRKPFFPAIGPVVAALAMLTFGCAVTSEIAKDLGSPPVTEQPRQNPTDPDRVLVKVWSAPGAFDKATHATLVGQVLYVAGMPASLHAIDTYDGLRLWSHPCKGPLVADIAQTGDEVILVEGRDVVKLDADNGVELTRDRTRLGIRSAVLPGKGSWTVATNDDRLWGMVPDTGRGYWRITFDDPIADMVEGDNDALYVQTLRGTLYRVSRTMRAIEWRRRFPKPGASPMALAGNRLLVGNEDYFLYEISAEEGEILSRACLSAPVLGTPLLAEPFLYIGAGDGKLYAIDTESLAVKWTIEGATRALTVAGDDVIYLANRDGRVCLGVADTNTGKVLTETSAEGFDIFVAAPVSGVVFAVARNGGVVAVAHRAVVDSLPDEPVAARAYRDPQAIAVKMAVRAIYSAAKAADTEKLLEGLTPESAEFVKESIETEGDEKVHERFSPSAMVIGKIVIENETATVRTNILRHPGGQLVAVPMARIGGEWKLDLVEALKEMADE